MYPSMHFHASENIDKSATYATWNQEKKSDEAIAPRSMPIQLRSTRSMKQDSSPTTASLLLKFGAALRSLATRTNDLSAHTFSIDRNAASCLGASPR